MNDVSPIRSGIDHLIALGVSKDELRWLEREIQLWTTLKLQVSYLEIPMIVESLIERKLRGIQSRINTTQTSLEYVVRYSDQLDRAEFKFNLKELLQGLDDIYGQNYMQSIALRWEYFMADVFFSYEVKALPLDEQIALFNRLQKEFRKILDSFEEAKNIPKGESYFGLEPVTLDFKDSVKKITGNSESRATSVAQGVPGNKPQANVEASDSSIAKTINAKNQSSPSIPATLAKVNRELDLWLRNTGLWKDLSAATDDGKILRIGTDNVKISSKGHIGDYTYDLSKDPIIDVGDGATIDYFSLVKKGIVKDSKGQNWYVDDFDSTGQVSLIKIEEDKGVSSIFTPRIYTISSSSKESFIMKPRTAPSVLYKLEITVGDQPTTSIDVIFPESLGPNETMELLQRIRQEIGQLSLDQIDVINQIVVYPEIRFWNNWMDTGVMSSPLRSNAAASAGAKEISFYPSNGYEIEHALSHEFGHLVAEKLYNDFSPGEPWKKAMQLDAHSVSTYGDYADYEDFAEAVKLYFMSDGGRNPSSVRAKYAHRFEILDKIFETNPELRNQILNDARKRLAAKGIIFLGAGSMIIYGGQLIYFDQE